MERENIWPPPDQGGAGASPVFDQFIDRVEAAAEELGIPAFALFAFTETGIWGSSSGDLETYPEERIQARRMKRHFDEICAYLARRADARDGRMVSILERLGEAQNYLFSMLHDYDVDLGQERERGLGVLLAIVPVSGLEPGAKTWTNCCASVPIDQAWMIANMAMQHIEAKLDGDDDE